MNALHADVTPEGLIRMEGDARSSLWIQRLVGVKRCRDGAWTMPASLDTCQTLLAQRVFFSPTLAAYAERADRIRRYIDSVKRQEHAEPLKPVPIKAPYALYQHQIKAYNIALALFGRGARQEAAK